MGLGGGQNRELQPWARGWEARRGSSEKYSKLFLTRIKAALLRDRKMVKL